MLVLDEHVHRIQRHEAAIQIAAKRILVVQILVLIDLARTRNVQLAIWRRAHSGWQIIALRFLERIIAQLLLVERGGQVVGQRPSTNGQAEEQRDESTDHLDVF